MEDTSFVDWFSKQYSQTSRRRNIICDQESLGSRFVYAARLVLLRHSRSAVNPPWLECV